MPLNMLKHDFLLNYYKFDCDSKQIFPTKTWEAHILNQIELGRVERHNIKAITACFRVATVILISFPSYLAATRNNGLMDIRLFSHLGRKSVISVLKCFRIKFRVHTTKSDACPKRELIESFSLMMSRTHHADQMKCPDAVKYIIHME
jgi:hypothetical protein